MNKKRTKGTGIKREKYKMKLEMKEKNPTGKERGNNKGMRMKEKRTKGTGNERENDKRK